MFVVDSGAVASDNACMASPISCPHCRKVFRWTAELAGGRVRCSCGARFAVPMTPNGVVELLERPGEKGGSAGAGMEGQPVVASEVETYELALDASDPEALASRGVSGFALRCARCNAAMRVGASVCLNCGFDARAGEVISTRVVDEPATEPVRGGIDLDDAGGFDPSAYGTSAVARALSARQDEARASVWRERVLPIALLCIGLVWFVLVSVVGTADWSGVLMRGGVNAVVMAGGTCLFVLAMFATVSMFGLSYGSMGSAMLKGVALGVSTGFLADTLVLWSAELVMMLGVYGVIGLVAFTLALNGLLVVLPAWFLFELDLQEAGILLGVFSAFKLMIGMLVLVIGMTM